MKKSFIPKIYLFLAALLFCIAAHAEIPNSCGDFFDSKGRPTQKLSDLFDVARIIIPSSGSDVCGIHAHYVIKKWRTHPGVERWDLELAPNLKDRADAIIDLCENNFGMKNEVLPDKNVKYSGVIFLGASFN